jgi:hypothetical protein
MCIPNLKLWFIFEVAILILNGSNFFYKSSIIFLHINCCENKILWNISKWGLVLFVSSRRTYRYKWNWKRIHYSKVIAIRIKCFVFFPFVSMPATSIKREWGREWKGVGLTALCAHALSRVGDWSRFKWLLLFIRNVYISKFWWYTKSDPDT